MTLSRWWTSVWSLATCLAAARLHAEKANEHLRRFTERMARP